MRKRNIILTTVAILVIAGVAALLWRFDPGPPQPIFEGKPLTVWLVGLYRMTGPRSYDSSMAGPGAQAVRALGTNAVPYLVHMLTANRRRLMDKPALWAKNKAALPLSYTTARERVMRAAFACELLGRKAGAAIHALIPLLKDQDADIRAQVVVALCFIQQDPDIVVPLLAQRLADTDVHVQEMAIRGLPMFGAKARVALPALRKLAQSQYRDLRAQASDSMQRIESAQEQ
jgi:HEAT repeats